MIPIQPCSFWIYSAAESDVHIEAFKNLTIIDSVGSRIVDSWVKSSFIKFLSVTNLCIQNLYNADFTPKKSVRLTSFTYGTEVKFGVIKK